MAEETPKETPATPEESKEEAPTPPAEKKPEEKPEESTEEKPEETPTETPPEDIDYNKELQVLEDSKPPESTVPKRTEKEKAKFTLEKIFERHPDLREGEAPIEYEEEDKLSQMEQRLQRTQAEGIIRNQVKNEKDVEGAVRYMMWFFDNRITKTGNIHKDTDDAMWLANKNRTRNALKEQQRQPPAPGAPAGPGQKASVETVPELPAEEVERMLANGWKKTAKGWEGKIAKIEWNKEVKKWEQFEKVNDKWQST